MPCGWVRALIPVILIELRDRYHRSDSDRGTRVRIAKINLTAQQGFRSCDRRKSAPFISFTTPRTFNTRHTRLEKSVGEPDQHVADG